MTTTTAASSFFAAIDATNSHGAVYGVGTTEAAALAQALSVGDPCAAHDERAEGHRPEDHFAIVPCTRAAYDYVNRWGGAPSRELSVSYRDGVELRAEEE